MVFNIFFNNISVAWERHSNVAALNLLIWLNPPVLIIEPKTVYRNKQTNNNKNCTYQKDPTLLQNELLMMLFWVSCQNNKEAYVSVYIFHKDWGINMQKVKKHQAKYYNRISLMDIEIKILIIYVLFLGIHLRVLFVSNRILWITTFIVFQSQNSDTGNNLL